MQILIAALFITAKGGSDLDIHDYTDKKNTVYSHNEILFHYKKESST